MPSSSMAMRIYGETEIVAQFPSDIRSYARAKAPYIIKITAEALEWYNSHENN